MNTTSFSSLHKRLRLTDYAGAEDFQLQIKFRPNLSIEDSCSDIGASCFFQNDPVVVLFRRCLDVD